MAGLVIVMTGVYGVRISRYTLSYYISFVTYHFIAVLNTYRESYFISLCDFMVLLWSSTCTENLISYHYAVFLINSSLTAPMLRMIILLLFHTL